MTEFLILFVIYLLSACIYLTITYIANFIICKIINDDDEYNMVYAWIAGMLLFSSLMTAYCGQ